MIDVLRHPPKEFEALIKAHFRWGSFQAAFGFRMFQLRLGTILRFGAQPP
jgi:hypothetical protein